MQLKIVGESLNASKVINNIISQNSTTDNVKQAQMVKNGLEQYSLAAVKASLSQSELDKSQIKTILSLKGLKGQALKTATTEVIQAQTTNNLANSQKAASVSTIGLGTSIKGLGASLKGLATSHPILLAITIGIAAIAATVKIVDACTTSFDELKEKISELKQNVSDSQAEMDSISSQLSEVNQKIQDIKSLGSLTYTEEGELKNLQAQKTELQNLYNIEKARHDLAKSDLEKMVI